MLDKGYNGVITNLAIPLAVTPEAIHDFNTKIDMVHKQAHAAVDAEYQYPMTLNIQLIPYGITHGTTNSQKVIFTDGIRRYTFFQG